MHKTTGLWYGGNKKRSLRDTTRYVLGNYFWHALWFQGRAAINEVTYTALSRMPRFARFLTDRQTDRLAAPLLPENKSDRYHFPDKKCLGKNVVEQPEKKK